ncbi:hypothetical protein SAMN04489732_108288 [Amycolatopsis saalfeldensis]|uniref:Uncharacterized protein n=1 Tax=Amycolatopsis saalfeldensis TaxID=394193 RepID=A0A1H8XQQ1_9PSEU|nr:hypothetical protein SAMN04489732_108288 [Amycolatopsis saalfeldensis]
MKTSAEEGQNQLHVQRILIEVLAQQVATRRYLLGLTAIAVRAMEVSHVTSSSESICSAYSC